MQRASRKATGLSGLIATNLVSALSGRLQDVTEKFRREQGSFLKCNFAKSHSIKF